MARTSRSFKLCTVTSSRTGPLWLLSCNVPRGGTLTTVCPDSAGCSATRVCTGPIAMSVWPPRSRPNQAPTRATTITARARPVARVIRDDLNRLQMWRTRLPWVIATMNPVPSAAPADHRRWLRQPPATGTPPAAGTPLAARHGADDHEWLGSGRDRGRQRRIRRFVRQILLAGEETHERTALSCPMVADRAPQHRIAGLKLVENQPQCRLASNVELHFTADARQPSQVRREHHPDHDSVWTSTDSTAGRARTMGAQLSPASADAYTWPPVVPK